VAYILVFLLSLPWPAADGKCVAGVKEVISPLLDALRYPRPPLQRSTVAVLHVLFDEGVPNTARSLVILILLIFGAENLQPIIFHGLLSMLQSRKAGPLYGATTALRVLCSNSA